MFLVRMVLDSLGLTILIEEIAALIWGLRTGKELITVLWVNIVTNSLVTLLRYVSNQWIHFNGSGVITIAVLELAVLITEWRLFKKFLPRISHPFIFSLTLNAASYASGLLLPVILEALIRI